MVDSKTAAGRRPKLQFSYYDSTLPNRLANDIKQSSFNTRPKYLNALIEKVLSLPMRTSMSSHIDELFAWIELFETLPTERIRRLAPTQNRNFDQMVRHLLEVALSYYPEDPQSSASTKSIDLHRTEAHQQRQSDYDRWSNQPASIRTPSL